MAIIDRTVGDVLSRWPSTASVFLSYRLACIGCPLSRFESIADVASIYKLDLGDFLQKLHLSIETAQDGDAPNATTSKHTNRSGTG
jgi:hybrid cluster-associated redox disulfide protein